MVWKILLILCIALMGTAALAVIVWVGYQLTSPYGQQFEAQYAFVEDSPALSHLGPWQRLDPPSSDQYGPFQRIKDDLVYLTFTGPSRFKKLEVTIRYSASPDQVVSFGPEIAPDVYRREILPTASKDKVMTAQQTFDLGSVLWSKKKIRFSFAAPGLRVNERLLKVYEIKFRLVQPTIDESSVNPRVLPLIHKLYKML